TRYTSCRKKHFKNSKFGPTDGYLKTTCSTASQHLWTFGHLQKFEISIPYLKFKQDLCSTSKSAFSLPYEVIHIGFGVGIRRAGASLRVA
ncbi:MAG: hypothetical protein PVF25_18105, partial [Desulfobacterales bacterium]